MLEWALSFTIAACLLLIGSGAGIAISQLPKPSLSTRALFATFILYILALITSHIHSWLYT